MKATPEDLRDVEAANERFRADAARFGLRFRCEDCAHVHAPTSSCSLGYPNHWLRGEVRVVQPDGMLSFCKYFELGESHVPDAADPDAPLPAPRLRPDPP